MAADEYGQFVATAHIEFDGVRAFAAGDPVPASTVKARPELLEEKMVAKVGTKAAEAAAEV